VLQQDGYCSKTAIATRWRLQLKLVLQQDGYCSKVAIAAKACIAARRLL